MKKFRAILVLGLFLQGCEDASLSKLPLCCQTAIEVCADVGILPIFLEKEYKQLKKSSEQFIKAAEKRGV